MLAGTEYWFILSYAVGISGGIKYILDTVRGSTKPNRVTWFFWSLAPSVGTYVAISSGADIFVAARVFLSGFMPLLVFIASFVNKNSYWEITKFDILCGIFSFVSLGSWWLYHSSDLAILLAIVADVFAALPTLYKSWKFPETETAVTFMAGMLSSLLILPTIKIWNITNSGFQIYLLVMDLLIVLAILRKKIFKYAK